MPWLAKLPCFGAKSAALSIADSVQNHCGTVPALGAFATIDYLAVLKVKESYNCWCAYVV